MLRSYLVLTLAATFCHVASARNSSIFSFNGAGAGPNSATKPGRANRGSVPSYTAGTTPIRYPQGWAQNDPGWNGWAYVLNGDIPVNVIYYHNNDLPSSLDGRLQNFISNISWNDWFKAVKKYYNKGYIGWNPPRQYVRSIYKGSVDWFHCSWGWKNKPGSGCRTTLTGDDITNVIRTVLYDNSAFPNTPDGNDNAVYLFVMSPSISETVDGANWFGSRYCSYHSTFYASENGKWLKYAVGRASGSGSCQFATDSINGNADNAMLSIAHELVEVITSPNPANNYVTAGWSDSSNNESMDKCESSVPNVQYSNGKSWNVNVNGQLLYLPAVWDPEAQACTMNGKFTLRGYSNQGTVCADAGNWSELKAQSCNNDENGNQAIRFEGGQLKVGNECLEVEGNWYGARVKRVGCDSNRIQQKFKYYDHDTFNYGDSAIHLAMDNNYCLDVYAYTRGNNILAWGCNGAANQKWTFQHFY